MYQLLFYCLILLIGVECCGDYYWRNYNGTIPTDAIPASNVTDAHIFYIGQVYLHKHGLILGTIEPGKNEVSTGFYGVKTTNSIIQVLCAKKISKYYWIETSTDHYLKNVTKRCPVIGGFDQKVTENGALKVGTLHVGRYYYEGNAVVGNINYYNKNPIPLLFFTLHDFPTKDLKSGRFEALIYSEYPIIPIKNKFVYS